MDYSYVLRTEIKRLQEERDSNAAIVEALAERINHELGDYGAYVCAMDESTCDDLPEQLLNLNACVDAIDRLNDNDVPPIVLS